MTFSEALDAIKDGKIITRNAWHGEVFVYLEKARVVAVDEGHGLAAVFAPPTEVNHHPYLNIRTHGMVTPWLPGFGDIFADDWSEVAA